MQDLQFLSTGSFGGHTSYEYDDYLHQGYNLGPQEVEEDLATGGGGVGAPPSEQDSRQYTSGVGAWKAVPARFARYMPATEIVGGRLRMTCTAS